jgi:hypothetical protein
MVAKTYATVRPRLNERRMFLSEEAYSRNMFITQPPIRRLWLNISGREYYESWEDRRGLPKWYEGPRDDQELIVEGGIRFIDLVKHIRRWCNGRTEWLNYIVIPDVELIELEELQKVATKAKEVAHLQEKTGLND